MRTESLAKMKKLEHAARQRIIARGKIDFRVEPELVSNLLDLAKERRVPLGTLVRELVKAQLELEIKRSPSQLDKIERKIDKLLSIRLD
jgi:hypothetical protein